MRFEQWERRLLSRIELYGRVPFVWGKFDCCLFVADCVWALTQKNPATPWRGTYSDEAGAQAIIAAAGGVAGLAAQALAGIGVTERIPPAFGQRGDPCVFVHEGRDTMGIVYGAEIMAKAPTGLARVPLDRATVCWAIR